MITNTSAAPPPIAALFDLGAHRSYNRAPERPLSAPRRSVLAHLRQARLPRRSWVLCAGQTRARRPPPAQSAREGEGGGEAGPRAREPPRRRRRAACLPLPQRPAAPSARRDAATAYPAPVEGERRFCARRWRRARAPPRIPARWPRGLQRVGRRRVLRPEPRRAHRPKHQRDRPSVSTRAHDTDARLPTAAGGAARHPRARRRDVTRGGRRSARRDGDAADAQARAAGVHRAYVASKFDCGCVGRARGAVTGRP